MLWHRMVYSQCVLLNRVFKRQKLLGIIWLLKLICIHNFQRRLFPFASFSRWEKQVMELWWTFSQHSCHREISQRMVSDFTYRLSCNLSGCAISKIPFLWFFPKTIDVKASTVPLPSRGFGYRPITTCFGRWTVLAAIWFNVKLISSVGSRFFRLSQLKLTIIFPSLRFPWCTSLEFIECKLDKDQILQVSFAYLTEVNYKAFDIVHYMPIVLQFVFVQTAVTAAAKLN